MFVNSPKFSYWIYIIISYYDISSFCIRRFNFINYRSMEQYYYLIWVALIFVLVFWFRKHLRNMDLQAFTIALVSLLGWIVSASLVLYIVNLVEIKHMVWYSGILWPILEELTKFVIIYIIISIIKHTTKNPMWWLAVWILVWIWFGLYENYIYLESWVNDIMVILFRSLFVWWLILHPLTSGIVWYMCYLSHKIVEYLPWIFNKLKIWFKWADSIVWLVGFVYKESWKSIYVVLDFFKRILVLDLTIKCLLWTKTESQNWYGHWPVELQYEGLILAIWIHILYNSLLTFMWTHDYLLAVIWIVIAFALFRLFEAIYKSFFLWWIISLVIASWFLIRWEFSDKLMMLWLILLMMNLIFLAISIERRLNSV